MVGLTAAVGLVAASAADAGTLTLNWVERSSPRYGYPAMTFVVKSVTVDQSSWSVRASVSNRSRQSIHLLTDKDFYFPAKLFGRVPPPARCNPLVGAGCTWSAPLQATSFRPRVPSVLRSGARWNGVFSGTGTLPRGKLINVAFGAFYSPKARRNFSWTTTHGFKLVTARPKTLKLNWVEQASATYYPAALTFKVQTVTLGVRAWSVRASVTNRSTKTIRIVKAVTIAAPRYQYPFSLLFAPICKPPNISCQLEVLAATYFKPAKPPQLRPGQTWTGTFGGPNLPPIRKLINVGFGEFVVGDKSFSYITTHAFKR